MPLTQLDAAVEYDFYIFGHTTYCQHNTLN